MKKFKIGKFYKSNEDKIYKYKFIIKDKDWDMLIFIKYHDRGCFMRPVHFCEEEPFVSSLIEIK